MVFETAHQRIDIMRLLLILLILSQLFTVNSLYAQEQSGEKRKLFFDDRKDSEIQKTRQIRKFLQTDKAPASQVEFKAPNIEYDRDGGKVKGSGGVLLSGRGANIQADEATYDSKSQDVDLSGNVLITSSFGTISAAEGRFNMENETGDFRDSEVLMEEGAYRLGAEEMIKLSEFEYELKDSEFSTCQCEDGSLPWSIASSSCSITQESYAHARDAKLEIYDTPVFYSPYFAFPVKSERSSGLLAPTYGLSDEDGFQIRAPIFGVIDDYSDLTVSPFIETKSRQGSFLDYREAYSRRSSLSGRLIYSDESLRDGDLRGTVTTGLNDPTFDEDRFGGYLLHKWSTKNDADVPTNFAANLRYVSDDLLLREVEDNGIGRSTSRYVTSTALLRNQYGSYVSSELWSEYNQALETDDDLVFQRMPGFAINATKSARPFGYNPFGVKLVSKNRFEATRFSRDTGYEGNRYDFAPGLLVPFRFKSYFNSQLSATLHHTTYQLGETLDPLTPTVPLEDSPARTVPVFSYRIGTAVEKVYDMPEESWLKTITEMGTLSRGLELKRLKHTVEPSLRYTYVPDEEQDDLPLFDALDRIREKSLIIYGATTRLYGRFLPETVTDTSFLELTPRVEDLPLVEEPSLIEGLSGPSVEGDAFNAVARGRRGEIRELASFGVYEGYDYIEASKDIDPLRGPYTDISTNVAFNPTRHASLSATSNYNRDAGDFSSWALSSALFADRGDSLRARYTFIDESLSQVEAGAELIMSHRFRVGYYARYDEETSEFIENTGALRMKSACNCWYLDLGFSDRSNPNRQKLMLTFTFAGLGDITQDIPVLRDEGQVQ